jgi:hypothetical protein
MGPNDIVTPVSDLSFWGEIQVKNEINEEKVRRELNQNNLPRNYKGAFFEEVGRGSWQALSFVRSNFKYYSSSVAKNQSEFIPPPSLKRAFRFFDHMPAKLLAERIGISEFNKYKKISVVRNPFDQAISDFADQKFRVWEGRNISFDEYLKYRLPRFFEKNWLIISIDDRPIIDNVIKYETLNDDIASICELFRIEKSKVLEGLKSINIHGEFRKKSDVLQLNDEQKSIIRYHSKNMIDNFYPELND